MYSLNGRFIQNVLNHICVLPDLMEFSIVDVFTQLSDYFIFLLFFDNNFFKNYLNFYTLKI